MALLTLKILTLKTAYVGSLLQCAPAIRQFCCATAGILPTGPSKSSRPPRYWLTSSVHAEAQQFLRSHVRLVAADLLELGYSLASLSVSIQAARTKSVQIAGDLLSVDALQLQPCITGILPIVPPLVT